MTTTTINKNLLIPAVLAATVLVAGIFAFMPVEKASTVHSQILSNTVPKLAISVADAATVAGETFTLTCTADYAVVGLTFDMGAATFDAADDFNAAIGGDDIAANVQTALGAVHILGSGFSSVEAATSAQTLIVTAAAGGFASGNEDIEKARASYLSTGTCSWTGFE